jgi:hypothetical protein
MTHERMPEAAASLAENLNVKGDSHEAARFEAPRFQTCENGPQAFRRHPDYPLPRFAKASRRSSKGGGTLRASEPEKGFVIAVSFRVGPAHAKERPESRRFSFWTVADRRG